MELAGRLSELSRLLREAPGRVPEAADALLAPDLKAARLVPLAELSVGKANVIAIIVV